MRSGEDCLVTLFGDDLGRAERTLLLNAPNSTLRRR